MLAVTSIRNGSTQQIPRPCSPGRGFCCLPRIERELRGGRGNFQLNLAVIAKTPDSDAAGILQEKHRLAPIRRGEARLTRPTRGARVVSPAIDLQHSRVCRRTVLGVRRRLTNDVETSPRRTDRM